MPFGNAHLFRQARKNLGYEPKVDLEEGVQLAAEASTP